MDNRERLRLYMASRRAKLIALGLCYRCGLERSDHFKSCRKCRIKVSEWRQKAEPALTPLDNAHSTRVA